MDFNFWTGIVLGVVLSIPAGFFVNLYTERVQRWLDSRRMVSRSRSLRKEKTQYKLVLRLRSDPHFATQFHCGRVSRLIALFSLTVFICVYAVGVAIRVPPVAHFWEALSLFFLSLSIFTYSGYLRTLRKLGNFETYRDELQSRWSDEIWDVPPSDEGR